MRICKHFKEMPATRGALIVFEGCDRSGKTTQCKKLGMKYCDHHFKNNFRLR